MKIKHALRYVLFLPVLYILFHLFVKQDAGQFADFGKSISGDQTGYQRLEPRAIVVVDDKAPCQVVHVAVLCDSPTQARELGFLLKTLVFYRRAPLHLHIVANESCTLILRTLLDTWDIEQFSASFYKQGHGAVVPALHTILPNTLDKIIYLHHSVRFLSDVSDLWALFKAFSFTQYIGLIRDHVARKTVYGDYLVLLHLDRVRVSESAVHDLFSRKSPTPPPGDAVWLPCSWGVDLKNLSYSTTCVHNHYPQAAIWNRGVDEFVQSPLLERMKERVVTVLETSPYTLRQKVMCSNSSTSPEVKDTLPFSEKSCVQYRYATTAVKRRTHLYFIGSPDLPGNTHPNEITLLTQLTLDRFSVFEHMMKNWKGPAAALFHVSDAESIKLPPMVAASKSLSGRKNIAYHLVYKRMRYYPINYLRNVALNHTGTPYVLFVDVDLVPNAGLYPMLKKLIPLTMAKRPNVTLVVPAFEALHELPTFPKDKDALLKLMKEKKVIGYRMDRGWNLGHKPTNFDKWQMAEETYKAVWKDAFEPYVVMRTGEGMPRYHEGLLERMGDKIAYGREVYARGYEFWVMPEGYVIHLPHPKSEGTQLWLTERGYMRCGAVLINEFKQLLKDQHPDRKF